jgi:hypothetical protein
MGPWACALSAPMVIDWDAQGGLSCNPAEALQITLGQAVRTTGVITYVIEDA